MKKGLFTSIFFIVFAFVVNSQTLYTDSLRLLLQKSSADTNGIKLLLRIAQVYYFSKPDSSLLYSDRAIKLSRELHSVKGEIEALNYAGESLRFLGDYPKALSYDIVKAHGGELKVETKEGEGSELVISLPSIS